MAVTPLADRFLQPANPSQRQYEALRARFVDGCSLSEAASRFGYSRGSFRNLCAAFQRNPDRSFFHPPPRAPKPSPAADSRAERTQRVLQLRSSQQLSAYQIAAALDREHLPASVSTIAAILRRAGLPRLQRRPASRILESARPLQAPLSCQAALDLSPRSFRTPFGGLFLFLPLLASLRFDQLAARSGLPGSDAIPAACACRSLLALKLWGIGRPTRVMPDILDHGLALFAGLNAFPKRSSLTEYSCRIDPRLLPAWSAAWLDAVEQVGLPRGASFDLDFHTIPYHGDQALLEKHYVSKRSRRQNGVLAFLARDTDAGVFCFADATVRKSNQHDAILRFVDAFEQRTGSLPGELVFDSRLTTYASLAQLHAQGIRFLTLRRRSAKLLQTLRETPADQWKRVRLTNVGRRYRNPRTLASTVSLRDYPAPVRQIAVADLGHEDPTLLLTNQLDTAAAALVDRYARRMVIENAIAESIEFFHMDALSAAVPLQIDADLQFTVMASTLYRLLARRIGHQHERTKAQQLFDRFVRTAATVRIGPELIEVRLGRRAHNPLLIAAGFGQQETAIPWLANRKLRIVIGHDEPKQSHLNM